MTLWRETEIAGVLQGMPGELGGGEHAALEARQPEGLTTPLYDSCKKLALVLAKEVNLAQRRQAVDALVMSLASHDPVINSCVNSRAIAAERASCSEGERELDTATDSTCCVATAAAHVNMSVASQ